MDTEPIPSPIRRVTCTNCKTDMAEAITLNLDDQPGATRLAHYLCSTCGANIAISYDALGLLKPDLIAKSGKVDVEVDERTEFERTAEASAEHIKEQVRRQGSYIPGKD